MNNKAWMDAVVDDGDKIWFSIGNFNGLYCYDKKTEKTLYKGVFPKEKITETRLYGGVIKIENKLFFSPVKAKNIAIYDIKVENFILIPIEYKVEKDFRCFNIARWNNYVYFISTAFQPLIIRLNTLDMSIKYYSYDISCVNLHKDFISRETVVIENSLYFTITDKPIVMEFDLENEVFVTHHLPTTECFNTISFWDNYFVLCGKNKIIKWNLQTNSIVSFNCFPNNYGIYIKKNNKLLFVKGFQETAAMYEFPFFKSILINDKLLLLSAVMNMSLLFELNTGNIKECKLCEDRAEKLFVHNNSLTKLQYLFVTKNYREEIIFFSVMDMSLYISDKKIHKIKKINLLFPSNYDGAKQIFESEKFFYENSIFFRLNTLLKNVEKHKGMNVVNNATIGKEIYQMIG